MAGLLKLWHEKHNPPPDPNHISFHGKTVLITGATSGLGFEASAKFLQQGVSSLITGSRDQERGQQAQEQLEQRTGRTGVVQVWPLDLSSFRSVIEFADRVHREVEKLDIVILNAGVMHRDHTLSRDGWEDTLQVNVLSTAMLALLLLPKLRETGRLHQPQLDSDELTYTPHLVVVSSGTIAGITQQDLLPQLPLSSTEVAILDHLNDPSNGLTKRKLYGISKLLVEYAIRSIADFNQNSDDGGIVHVIVNTVRPGLCVSSLGRKYTDGRSGRWAVTAFNTLCARTTEAGSRVLVSASVQGDDSNGRMWDGNGYFDETGTLLSGDEGDRLRHLAWKEIADVLKEQASKFDVKLDLQA